MSLIWGNSSVDIDLIRALDIVADVRRVQESYKNTDRKFHPNDTGIKLNDEIRIGERSKAIMADPCSVESKEQILTVAHRMETAGAKFSTLGVNLTKLESRPIPGEDFRFSFNFDFDASVYSPDAISLLSDLEVGTENFTFLGAYREV
jgi:hypothetical protein